MLRLSFIIVFLVQFITVNAQHPQLVIPLTHEDGIQDATITTDKKILLSYSADKACIWDIRTGKILYTINESFHDAKFSNNNRTFIALTDTSIETWDLYSGMRLANIRTAKNYSHIQSTNPYLMVCFYDSVALYDLPYLRPINKVVGRMIGTTKDGANILTFSRTLTTILVRSTNTTNWEHQDMLQTRNMPIFSCLSSDARQFATIEEDTSLRIYDLVSGNLVAESKFVGLGDVHKISFSRRNRSIVMEMGQNTQEWRVDHSSFIVVPNDSQLPEDSSLTRNERLSLRYKECHCTLDTLDQYLLVIGEDRSINLWDPDSISLIQSFRSKFQPIYDIALLNDTTLMVNSPSGIGKLSITPKGIGGEDTSLPRSSLISRRFSPSGRYSVANIAGTDMISILDNLSGEVILTIPSSYGIVKFDRGEKKILAIGRDSVKVFSMIDKVLISQFGYQRSMKYSWGGVRSASQIKSLPENLNRVLFAYETEYMEFIFSPGGNYVVQQYIWEGNAKRTKEGSTTIWSATSGERLRVLPGPVSFSSNDSKCALFRQKNNDLSIRLMSMKDWKESEQVGSQGYVNEIDFVNNDQNLLVTGEKMYTIIEIATGRTCLTVDPEDTWVSSIDVDAGSRLMMASLRNKIMIYQLGTWRPVDSICHIEVDYVEFVPQSHLIVSKTYGGMGLATIYDLKDHAALGVFRSSGWENNWRISANNVIIENPNAISILNTRSKNWYSLYLLDKNNWLVLDKDQHYDGSEMARKTLYYSCGLEIIDLEQLKDLSWEPNLISKLMGRDTEPISAQKLSDVQLCGYTPLIEANGRSGNVFSFAIVPRNGGLHGVSLSINGKQVRTYKTSELQFSSGKYLLSVSERDVRDFLVAGQTNSMSVKATTSDDRLFAKGPPVKIDNWKAPARPIPNLYCISIGICKYKGPLLNTLHYASQDALDFDMAVTSSSRKLLNRDGVEHVYNYVFNTTNSSVAQWPLKKNIVKTFAEISAKATANDIVLIFMSGHGVLNNKHFYYLTSDASAFDINGVENNVAISDGELNQWLRKIKAQKQVLILDACNSGQAMKNFIVRKDMPADQLRALEKLKDMTGIYILSASASGQAAFEISQFNQGLLTYSLLLGLKSGKGLRDNKYLDVSNWFQFAASEVKDLARNVKERQDPQIFENGSFELGIVDEELASKIKLSDRKPTFNRSTFINSELFTDNLKIGASVDRRLYSLTFLGKNSPLSFYSDVTGDNVYSINGIYNSRGNRIQGQLKVVLGQKIFSSTPIDIKAEELDRFIDAFIAKIIKDLNGN